MPAVLGVFFSCNNVLSALPALLITVVVPSKVKLDSPSSVLAVPLPVMILLSALLFIVVPLTVAKDNVPLPSVVITCPDVPSDKFNSATLTVFAPG